MSLSVSMSGMQVANTYMSAASHNIANTNTEDFRPQGVVSSESVSAMGAKVDEVSFAKEKGVNLEQELTSVKENEKIYSANAKVLQVQNDSLGRMLDINA